MDNSNYSKCLKEAQKYEYLIDFIKKSKNFYIKANKYGWLKDFTWLKRHYEGDENILTAKKHLIYKYEFPKFNSVYIGLTINLNRRHNKGHCKSGSVYNFCQEKGIQIPEPQIIENNLTIKEVKEREFYWVKYYKGKGYNLINKTKGGDSIGLLCHTDKADRLKKFLNKSKVIHNNFYSYELVEYKNVETKITIICPNHGHFMQSPEAHMRGQGCPSCSYIRSSKKNLKWGYEECLRVSNECLNITDFKKRYGSAYASSYRNGWLSSFFKRKKDSNSGRKMCFEEFVNRANKKHNKKYQYTECGFKNLSTKIIIYCPIHGEFSQTPTNHLKGQGCPKCGIYKRIITRRKKKDINGMVYL